MNTDFRTFSKGYLVGRVLVDSCAKRLRTSQICEVSKVSIPCLRSVDCYWSTSCRSDLSSVRNFLETVCGILYKQDQRRLSGYLTRLRGLTIKDFIESKGHKPRDFLLTVMSFLTRSRNHDYDIGTKYYSVLSQTIKVVGITSEVIRAYSFCIVPSWQRWTDENILKIIRYLREEVNVPKEYFHGHQSCMIVDACISGRLDVVKYFHEVLNFTIEDFRYENNMALYYTCKEGHIEVVRYLHEEIGLTIEDFRNAYLDILVAIFKEVHVPIARYLYEVVGITAGEFHSRRWSAIRGACRVGNTKMMEFLLKEVGISIESFYTIKDSYILEWICHRTGFVFDKKKYEQKANKTKTKID